MITGVVFQDFNANGTRDVNRVIALSSGAGTAGVANDRGLPGIKVRATDPAGRFAGVATTAADGSYSLQTIGSGSYRLEFDASTFPPGLVPGPFGPNNATSVRFVPDGDRSGIDIGLVRPDDYSQDIPSLVTNVYVFGDQINGARAPALSRAGSADSG